MYAVSASDPAALPSVTLLFGGVSLAALISRLGERRGSIRLRSFGQTRCVGQLNPILGIENPALFNNTVHNCGCRSIMKYPDVSVTLRSELLATKPRRTFRVERERQL